MNKRSTARRSQSDRRGNARRAVPRTALMIFARARVALALERREALRRIVREATTNAARHGAATRVTISLESVDSRLRLRICDDGCGFDASRDYPGFGLISMRERAASLGGTFQLSSKPGAGTTVVVRLP